MDESAWMMCSDPEAMRKFLGESASRRKLRLFAAACCRRVWQLLDKNDRKAVVVAERFAGGLIGLDELRQAGVRARRGASARREWWKLRGMQTAYAQGAAWCAADESDLASEAARQAAAALSVVAIEEIGEGHASAMGAGAAG